MVTTTAQLQVSEKLWLLTSFSAKAQNDRNKVVRTLICEVSLIVYFIQLARLGI